jgi:hypothetical protein
VPNNRAKPQSAKPKKTVP